MPPPGRIFSLNGLRRIMLYEYKKFFEIEKEGHVIQTPFYDAVFDLSERLSGLYDCENEREVLAGHTGLYVM